MVLGLGLAVSCTDSDKDDADAALVADTGDDWVELEDDDEDDEDKEDKEDKEDDEDKEEADPESGGEFIFVVDLGSGTGSAFVELRDGIPCEAGGVLSAAEEAEGCAACSMATTFTLSDTESSGGDCDFILFMEDEPVSFGQGSEALYDLEGTWIYPLYEFDHEEPDEGWVVVDGGFSLVEGTEWLFGLKWE